MTSPARTVYFVTHPDVLVDPAVPVPEWPLSPNGRERMARALMLPWIAGVSAVWCSTERKARDGAEILAAHLGLPVTELAELGENDRSSTGFLPKVEFEAVADLFCGHPEKSIRGWERAIDAQRRIVGAIETILTGPRIGTGDVAIVAHGGVGALLLCHLCGDPIGRQPDQPPTNGGNYFAFDLTARQIRQGWTAVDA